MTALDMFVLLLVGGLGIKGFSKGFVVETISLASWVAAFLAVRFLHGPVTAALSEPVGTEGGASVLTVGLVFGVVFFTGRLIAARLGTAARASRMGGFDRVLGAGFGGLKGLLAATLVFLLGSLVYDTIYGGTSERPDWVSESRTFPLLNASARAMVDFVGERQSGGVASGSS